jgi:hypothetical protein
VPEHELLAGRGGRCVNALKNGRPSVNKIRLSVSENPPSSMAMRAIRVAATKDRRRSAPEDPTEPDPGHAFAAAFAFLVEFCAM